MLVLLVFLFPLLMTLVVLLLPETKKGRKASVFKSGSVSVIIPAYNCEKTITQCLKSVLESQNQKPEVIVVDDGSTDGTVKKVEPFVKKFGVKLVRQRHLGKYAALNKGFELAQNRLLFRLDHDSLVKKGCFAKVVEVFEENTGAVVLKQTVANPKNRLTKFQQVECVLAAISGKIQDKINSVFLVGGSGIAISKDAWLNNKGFQNKQAEESDFVLRLFEKGWRPRYLSGVSVWTTAPDNPKGWLSQKIRWSKGQVEGLLTHWRLMVKNIHLLFLIQPQIIFCFIFLAISLISLKRGEKAFLEITSTFISAPRIVVSFFGEVLYSMMFRIVPAFLITGLLLSIFYGSLVKIVREEVSIPQILVFFYFFLPLLSLVTVLGYFLALKDLLIFGRIRPDKF